MITEVCSHNFPALIYRISIAKSTTSTITLHLKENMTHYLTSCMTGNNICDRQLDDKILDEDNKNIS